jgi:hypothetical protein
MAMRLFILSLPIVFFVGCASKRPHPVAYGHVPYTAHFDLSKCHYLPDGIRFRCKDVVFDPTLIDASKK